MINVTKSTGYLEPFSEDKVLSSIRRARIPQNLEESVLNHVKSKIYNNIPTSEIYHHISEFLGKSSSPFSKAKYGLKKGIMDLGPTGYPFEDFVSELLRMGKYITQVRQTLKGKCVNHEIDIIAEKNKKKSMIECKFHNSTGVHTDIHVSLYTKARFDDLKTIHSLDEAWLITNTRVTSDALSYALCSNLKVISWNYPEGKGLRDLIEKSRLHPLTVLSNLSDKHKQDLLQKHIVLCKEISNNVKSLVELGLPQDKIDNILNEAKFVCSIS